jgi:hypothetical protein
MTLVDWVPSTTSSPMTPETTFELAAAAALVPQEESP